MGVLFLTYLSFTVYGQEKNLMSSENIKVQDLWREYKNVKYKFQELHFDRKGNCTEEIRFNPKGKVVFHKAFVYENDRLKREIEMDSRGIIIQHIDYYYTGNILVEKKTLDSKGKLVLDEQYIYQYQD
jgi:hypothetical protein